MLRRLSLAIAVAAASVALVQAEETPLSSKTDLVTVYQEAAKNNADIAAARADYQARREVVPQARAGLLPNLSAGADIVAFANVARHQPTAKFLIGSGKVEELRDLVKAEEADLVIFNHVLTPSQERNLERVFECRVIDRTGLILDIFAQRARTHEGKLQVELAQLDHMSTRLVRGWTHLERQGGGIGMRGPGETQLETDRRLLRERVKALQARLTKLEKQREQGRRARQRAEVPVVSVVGYTNAGKSTLFNRLTKADVYAADQLFATLDPTLRKIHLKGVGEIILADTVGFIRHLPHDLVAAFKSTLQETRDADLQLHVVDVADPRKEHNIQQVAEVLADLVGEVVGIRLEPERRIQHRAAAAARGREKLAVDLHHRGRGLAGSDDDKTSGHRPSLLDGCPLARRGLRAPVRALHRSGWARVCSEGPRR